MFRPEKPVRDFFISDALELRRSPVHGTGVFAKRDIPKWTNIEFSPVITYHRDTHRLLRNSAIGPSPFDIVLDDPKVAHIIETYAWDWNKPEALCCIAWGWISLYNHSFKPNCVCRTQYGTEENDHMEGIIIMTARDVSAGEELLHRYTRWGDGLGFEPVEAQPNYTGLINPTSRKEFNEMNREKTNPLSNTLKNYAAARHIRNEDKLETIREKMRAKGPSLGSLMKSSSDEVEDES